MKRYDLVSVPFEDCEQMRETPDGDYVHYDDVKPLLLNKYNPLSPPADGTVALCRFIHPTAPTTASGPNYIAGMCKYNHFTASWETPYKGGLMPVTVDYYIDQNVVLHPVSPLVPLVPLANYVGIIGVAGEQISEGDIVSIAYDGSIKKTIT